MNLFRWLASILIVLAIFLMVVFGLMLAGAVSGGIVTAEVRRALLVLLLVVLVLLLVILILLCLARAKERLKDQKRLYREAHGDDRDRRGRAEEELARRFGEYGDRLGSLCDVLVRRKFPRACLPLPVAVTRRPDPCIYSQFYLKAAGLPVTWDNPNVEVLLAGTPQDTYNLAVSTTYDVRVGIENASPFFDGLGTQVQVNMLSFGIGGVVAGSTPIATYAVDVPAATSFPGVLRTFSWTTPPTPGHYCIQVVITHATDAVPSNNEGWNNTVIRDVAAGNTVRLDIPVWNALPLDRKNRGRDDHRFARVVLNVDSYELPIEQLPVADPDALFIERPPTWEAALTQTELTIPPQTAAPVVVALEVRVPAGAAPNTRGIFNVTGTAGGRPLGGITMILNVR